MADVTVGDDDTGALLRSRRFLDGLAEGIILQGPDGVIFDANEPAATLLGITPDQLRGRTSFDPRWRAVHEDGSPFPGEDHPATVTLRTGEPCDGVLMGVDAPGRGRRWLSITTRRMVIDGEVAGVAISFLDVTEAHEREVELAASEARYRLLATNASDVVLLTDTDAHIRWVSPAVTEVLGWAPEALLGTAATDLVHPDDVAELPPRCRAPGAPPGDGREDLTERLTVRMRTNVGTYRWVAGTLRVADEHQDATTSVVISVRDVDELVQARESARVREARRRAILDSQMDPHVLLGPVRGPDGSVVDLVYRDANAAACSALGLSVEGLVGTQMVQRWPSESATAFVHRVGELLESGVPLVMNDALFPAPGGDGERVYDVRGVRVEGAVSLTWRDVTDRHRDHEALHRSEERYRVLAENASDVVFRGTNEGIAVWVSPSVTPLTGWAPEDLEGRPFADLVHPDDHATVVAAQAELVAGRSQRFEARFRLADGSYRWVSVAVRPVFDADGRADGRVGGVTDIQAAVEARREIAAAAELTRVILDSTRDPILRFEPDLTVGFANHEAAVLAGISEADWVGHTLTGLGIEADAAATFEARVRRVLATAAEQVFELDAHNTAGHRWYESRLAPVFGDAGQVVAVISTSCDITDHHLAEAQLAQQATHDPLTGVVNRAGLEHELQRALSASRRSGRPTGVLMVDLDWFKDVNDNHGHQVGDEVLTAAARTLEACVRGGDLVGRLGGDEFVVVMRDLDDPDEANRCARRIVDTFRATPSHSQVTTTTVSVGAAVSSTATADELLAAADGAMYQAKQAGRNRSAAATPT